LPKDMFPLILESFILIEEETNEAFSDKPNNSISYKP